MKKLAGFLFDMFFIVIGLPLLFIAWCAIASTASVFGVFKRKIHKPRYPRAVGAPVIQGTTEYIPEYWRRG